MTAIPGYKILRKIGDGGMSTVHLAIQLSVGREVALKIMNAEMSANDQFSNLFYREANIIGTLSHPNIVSVYDVGNHEGSNYIAMDYMPGLSLREKVDEGLDIKESLKVIRDLASALDHIHQQGYVHLDLKPDNILFRNNGSPVILDFGIAVTQNFTAALGDESSVAGTPQYMSPEQSQGKAVDGRSDIYSLGIMLHECLTKEVPYKDTDPVQIAVKHMTAAIPSLPLHFKVAQPLLNKMLSKKPESRYQSGEELVQAIYILEASMAKNQGLLTQGEPTAMQAYSLLEALFSTLGAVVLLILKRFAGRFEIVKRLHFSGKHGLILLDKEEQGLFINDGMTPNPTMEVDTQRFDNKVAEAIADQTAKQLAPPLVMWAVTSLLLIAIVGGIALLTFNATQDVPSSTSPGEIDITAIKDPEKRDEAIFLNELSHSREASNETAVMHKLFIALSPTDAQVEILNHPADYLPGVLLPPGKYEIEVSHPNYFSQKKWITIGTDDVQENVGLAKRERQYKAGERFSEKLPKGVPSPEMVVIPAGNFKMGDSNGRGDKNARPAHTVTFKKPFAMSRTEITLGQFRRYAKATNLRLSSEVSSGRSDNQPVTSITWDEAKKYAQWITKVTGKKYRLPSEAEWEYAARAGTKGIYWWGGTSTKDQANCKKGCSSSFSTKNLRSTVNVGKYRANRFGLKDTSGNAAEWVADCYRTTFNGAPTDGSVWDTEGYCQARVVRGGSFADSASKLSNSYRTKVHEKTRRKEIGFRVLMEL